MTPAILRKELQAMIDTMPDQFIQAMMPLVTCFAEEYWRPKLEAVTEEESAMIDSTVLIYEKDPSSFTDWEDIK